MADFSTLGNRIKYGLEKTGKTQADLSRYTNIKSATVSQWCSGKVKALKSSNALMVSRFLEVDYNWLISGKGSPETTMSDEYKNEDQYVRVYLSHVTLQGGNGYEPSIEEESTGELIRLRRTFFDAHHLNASKCTCFPVEGESMQPLIYEGEYVIVDMTQNNLNEIKDGKIYAISVQGLPRIKRLFRKLDGSLIIRSENKNFGEDIVQGDQLNYIKLIGRVVARLGTKPFE